ncbi:Phage terminase large subunit [Acetobacteraceae bacterium EV16G]|uniref:Phage terminase large subunit n=1 Tax=Sorlinia euscelidii TaxID=3081148 RepID=A0ABU7U133_9PROT
MVDLAYSHKFGDFSRPYRYRIWYGGRGSSKSWTVARVLVAMAASRKLRILCCREYQNSINDSVKKLLTDQIDAMELTPWFKIQEHTITSSFGSEFLFKGLARNIQGIKSTEGIDICWVEEGQTISQTSLDILVPTIRKTGSEIWITYNPEHSDDPVYKLTSMLQDDPDAWVSRINWRDNPWFPPELEGERKRLLKHDPEAYEHVWEGACRTISEAVIFRHRVTVEAFESPSDARYYFGADWGFSQDPTALVRCFVQDDCLYIDHEAGGVGIELDRLPELFERIPGARAWPIKGDSARPETISYLANRHGFRISAAQKWPGSVEDGVERLKAFTRIIVHERCVETAREFRLYAYKVDKMTNDILPKIDDRYNHYIDAIRYALDGIITNKRRMPSFARYAAPAHHHGL